MGGRGGWGGLWELGANRGVGELSAERDHGAAVCVCVCVCVCVSVCKCVFVCIYMYIAA